MAEVETLAAVPKAASGKGAARLARRNGLVPGIIYGNSDEPLMLTIEHRRLAQAIGDQKFFIRLLDVEMDGVKHRVLPREIQFHPVSDAPIHIDFLRFDPERTITVAVPVRFLNERECPGIKRGGALNIVRHEVEVLCTADNIPPELTLDLESLEIGDALHSSSTELPEGVTFAITDRDFTIATIAAPTVIAEETDEEEDEEIVEEEETENEEE